MSASMSIVTGKLFVTLFVVPVVNVVVVEPYVRLVAALKFAREAPVQMLSTGVTVSVRSDAGAFVIRSESVAVSAPPVVGMLQLERSKWTNVHIWAPAPGATFIVFAVLLSPACASSA